MSFTDVMLAERENRMNNDCEDDPKTVLLCKLAGIVARRGTPTDEEVVAIRDLHVRVLHNEVMESVETKR